MRSIQLLVAILLVCVAMPSPAAVKAKSTFRRSGTLITIQVPVTLVGPNEEAFKSETSDAAVLDFFESEAEKFWNGHLEDFFYKDCYTFQIDVETGKKVIPEREFGKTHGGHTVYFGYSQMIDSSDHRIDPYTASIPAGWFLESPHALIGFFVGAGTWVETMNQTIVDKLGTLYEKHSNLPKTCIKATRTIESTLEGHPTAGETSVSTLVAKVAVEDDGSLSGDATVTVTGDGWSWTEGVPKCTYTYSGEGIDLAVSGSISDNKVDIVIDGAISYTYEHSCAPTQVISADYASTLGTVPLVGELDESGRFEEEQTIELHEYSTVVINTVIEIAVDEEAVA